MSHDRPRVSWLSLCLAVAGIVLLAVPIGLHLVMTVGGFTDASEHSGNPTSVLLAFLWFFAVIAAFVFGLPLTLVSFIPRRRAWKTATGGLVAYSAYACWMSVHAIGVLDTVLCGSVIIAGLALASLLISVCVRRADHGIPGTRTWIQSSAIVCGAASFVAVSMLLFFFFYRVITGRVFHTNL